MSDIRAEIAASPEAQADIRDLYANVLGRGADAGGLAYFTQLLAGGASLAEVKLGLANSAEITSHVTSTYLSVTGHLPNPAEIAAYHSELASGATYSLLQGELRELAGGAAAQNISMVINGVPETIASPALCSYMEF